MSFRSAHAIVLSWLVLGLALVLVASARPVAARSAPGLSGDPVTATPSSEAAAQAVTGTNYPLYLPFVRKAQTLSWRLGYNVGSQVTYDAVASLKAGWYNDWAVRYNPPRPQGMDFVQTVRLHQTLVCAENDPRRWDRTYCPYAQPYSYIAPWSPAVAAAIAQGRPGQIWLIGNEPDRRDWCFYGQNGQCAGTNHQDEMLPEAYARAYHDYYTAIKKADPAARIAIAGVIQGTPLRLKYLDLVLAAYQNAYGTPLPVDMWNVHAFILREVRGEWGADIPPGIPDTRGWVDADPTNGSEHMSLAVFDQNIRRFRQWMKDRGQQDKPLIVSEYGLLLATLPSENDPAQVQAYMTSTFDYFLNTADCAIGRPSDKCRLVQAWSWYTLDANAYNPLTRLIDPATGQMTATGRAFRDWSIAHMEQLGR